MNLDTGEVVMCQICDSQTYVRTLHKLRIHAPSEVLVANTFISQNSKLLSILEDNLDELETKLTLLDRNYWTEAAGFTYVEQLTIPEDLESIKSVLQGNYFAVLCISAVRLITTLSKSN